MDTGVAIVDYDPSHQPGIADLLDDIQSEFSESIYSRSPRESVAEPKYWVALHNNVVIGTVGVLLITGGNAALKGMMVQKDFRGNSVGLSKRLLYTALLYAEPNGVHTLYLGTMSQFKAAQSFYQKHSFRMIKRHDLPNDFIINPVDDLFFMLNLKD